MSAASPMQLETGFTVEDAAALGYGQCKRLANGQIAGIAAFMFTYGLVVNIDPIGYGHRYCYSSEQDAVQALEEWNGEGHPPGPWIKRKGLAPELSNPAFKGIAIVAERGARRTRSSQ